MDFSQSEFCEALTLPYSISNIYILIQVVTSFPTLFFVDAPYGKLTPAKPWTVRINHILGWFLMEASAWITFSTLLFIAMVKYDFLSVVNQTTLDSDQHYLQYITLLIAVCAVYPTHYFYRSIIYPRLMPYDSQMDLFPSLLALLFNICNATLHANNILCVQTTKTNLATISFSTIVVGVILYVLSWIGCHYCDRVLIGMRARQQQVLAKKKQTVNDQQPKQKKTQPQQQQSPSPSPTPTPTPSTTAPNPSNNDKYVVPTSNDSLLFSFTYTPNYFFEMCQWLSFAILTHQAYSSWLFVAATFANLFPRAVQYRHFYDKLIVERKKQKNE